MVKVAVILPCRNEESTIAETIQSFRQAMPSASIFVCDNGSEDNTGTAALRAGARVVEQPLLGKGHAVRRLVAEVDADVFVMADGDNTYDAASLPRLVNHLVSKRLDMVIGKRVGDGDGQYRFGHKFGNRLYSRVFSLLFGVTVEDLLSGYRVMSRRFAKTFPAASRGFEIETELNSHAAIYRLPFEELATPYKARPQGSASKLRMVRDGLRIMLSFIVFLRDYAPMRVFSFLAACLLTIAVAAVAPVIVDYLNTGLVLRFPTLIVSVSLALFAGVSLFVGMILQSMANARYHAFMLRYMAYGSAAGLGDPEPAATRHVLEHGAL